MLTNNILTSDMLDIIFDGRNKDYGAYELRRTYSKRIGKAMLITSIVVGLSLGGVVLGNSKKKQGPEYKISGDISITDLKDKPQEKLPEPEKPKPQEKPQVKEIAYVEPKIVDKDVIDKPPPSTDDLDSGKISLRDKDGIRPGDIGVEGPQQPGNNDVVVTKRPETNDNGNFVAIEIDAKFDGNWPAYLERNLVPEVPANNGAPAGRYRVEIKFVIDENGNIISAEPLTHLGYGLEDEAIRVIKKASGKWQAPYQNGVRLKATMRQTIIFEVQDEG